LKPNTLFTKITAIAVPRPRSFLNLLIVGLVIVSLPLTIGLVSTLSYLNKLTEQSIGIVDYTMNGVKDSQALSEYLLNEERYIRLFSIVPSEKHLSKAMAWNKRSANLLENLKKLPIVGDVHKNILTMESMQDSVTKDLIVLQQEPSLKKETVTRLLAKLNSVQAQGALVGRDISAWVRVEVENMNQFVNNARRTLISQAIGFILLTILMIAVVTILISWPIRQLNRSVERLGTGDFTSPINVVGPKDIEIVSEKLEWLRKRLETLEQEKKKFLAHISHELKTPLASIREGAGLLSEEIVGPLDDKQREVASILVNNSIKLQHLINNMIEINMARAGKKEMEREMIQLHRLIEQVAGKQSNKILSKKLKLEMQLIDAVIFGYKKELELIFENLFSNAIKFSPVGGIVGCTMKLIRKQVSCLIYDEGSGIPTNEEKKIFSPYYKIKDAENKNKEGSGLGLAIAKEYVENCGGTLEVIKSGEPGGRFCVILPLDQRERAA
jgi:two-component system, NtrC family, sensor histidine kinase GlrK